MKKIVLCLIISLFFCVFFAVGLFKPKDSRTVIKFSSWGSKSEIQVVKELLNEFEKIHPNIKIEFIHIPQNYSQKLQLLFASGLEPDVIFINNQNILLYIKAGLLEDLSNYFKDVYDGFYPEPLDCFKYEGKLYAIPRDISNLVIYYNKDIFKKNCIKMPDKIKDIFELRQIAKQVTSKDNWGINFETSPLYWGYYLSSNGGGIISDDKNKIIIGESKSIEALNLYASMLNKDKSMPSKADIGSMTTAQMFINGKLAMYLSGRWMVPKFREVISFNWDVIEFPAPNKVYIDSSGYAVTKKSKHKQEAVLLIKYLSNLESMSKFAQSGLIIPSVKDVIFQQKNEHPLNFKIFLSMLKNAKPTPVTEEYSVIMDEIDRMTESVFDGTKNAQDVFSDESIKRLESFL